MKEPTTICVKCRHHLSVGKGGVGPPWATHHCRATPLEVSVDPVTGARETATGNRHAYCRGVNKGNCPKYEAK